MKKKIVLAIFIALILIIVKYLGLDQYLTFDYIKNNQQMFNNYYLEHQLVTILGFAAVYILTTSLSIPGATLLTLLGGGIFGFMHGLVIVSFASTLGATLAFLLSRILFKDIIEKKFSNKIKMINAGVEKEGAFYLFSLRLVPIVPFFLINIGMGLTKIKVSTFFLVSQFGMLAGTAVYVNAGVQLSKLESLAGIISPSLLGSFVFLGIFPLVAKKLITIIKHKNQEMNI